MAGSKAAARRLSDNETATRKPPPHPHSRPQNHDPLLPSFSTGIALSSALRAELASGSTKKRGASTPYNTQASDYENEEVPLDSDVVLPGKKTKKVKGPAPVSEEAAADAAGFSVARRRPRGPSPLRSAEAKAPTEAATVRRGVPARTMAENAAATRDSALLPP